MINFSEKIALLKTEKAKKWIYIICGIALAFWLGFRIFVLITEHKQQVFNISRDIQNNGTPVWVMKVENKSDVLREPITVKNNRALVASGRVGLFRAGEKVGSGEIVSVSSSIDIDSGMYVVKMKGVDDGLQYVEYRRNGYFIPVYAIVKDGVYVVENGYAKYREVIIARQDADFALITQGLDDGDIVILSSVSENEKVQEQIKK